MTMEPKYTVAGQVVAGRQLGRRIGFPTANLPLDGACGIPDGVYAARVAIDGGAERYGAMANVGRNPSVGGCERRLEVHLFGFGGSLYGRRIEVELLQRIRPERRFPTVEALAEAIAEDARNIREILKQMQINL